jgi:hypothetical protein
MQMIAEDGRKMLDTCQEITEKMTYYGARSAGMSETRR